MRALAIICIMLQLGLPVAQGAPYATLQQVMWLRLQCIYQVHAHDVPNLWPTAVSVLCEGAVLSVLHQQNIAARLDKAAFHIPS